MMTSPLPVTLSATAAEPSVLYSTEGAVAIVTLNRPKALNSFTRQMHKELGAALDRAEADKNIRALVLTGAGRAFCAGADLSEFDVAPGPDQVKRADPGPIIEEAFNPTARRMAALRMPTVAAINGVAAGAGSSLALICDVAFAAPNASFIQAFSKIGLIPDAGGSWLLVQKLGLARATALAMTGDKLGAAQAKEWGVIWEVADDPVAAALAYAQKLASMPTTALVATRHLLREGTARTLDQQLNAERVLQSEMGLTHDYLEGVTAFLEKRPAAFTGA